MAELERATGVRLPVSSLLESPTVEHLAARVREARERTGDGSRQGEAGGRPSTLVPLRRSGSRPPVVLVHGATGDLLPLRHLAWQLTPDRPVLGFEAPGVDGRTRPPRSIEELAAMYLDNLRAFQGDGPCHLVGYEAGSLVAYELARRLEEAGVRASLTLVLPRPGALSAGPRKNALLDALRALRASIDLWHGAAISPQLRASFTERALLAAARRYVPRPRAGRLTVFWPAGRHVDGGEGPRIDWAALAGQGFSPREESLVTRAPGSRRAPRPWLRPCRSAWSRPRRWRPASRRGEGVRRDLRRGLARANRGRDATRR